MLLESLTRSVPRGAMSTIRRRVQEHVRAKTGTKDGQCGVVAWLRGEGLPSMSWAARRVGVGPVGRVCRGGVCTLSLST